jgi:CRISPR-associated protein Csd1
MILQQLWKDADAIMTQTGRGSLPPAMYMPKRVKWIVELSHDPHLTVQFTLTMGEDKKGIERLVPFIKRTVGVVPILLADKPSYTFGVRFADPKRDAGRDLEKDTARTVQEHQAYKDLLRACAKTTKDPNVVRIASFLETWNPNDPDKILPPDLGRDDLITFRVDETLPIQEVKVQDFWAKTAAGEEAGEAEKELELGLPAKSAMQCLVSGAIGPVEEMMPVPVKGLFGGKSEMAIVSANANAFESYGLTRAQTSPICRPAGERFGQALNAVLASGSHHQSAGRITYVFWARGGVVPLFAFQPPPDARDLQKLLTAVYRGDGSWANGLPSEEKFHLFGLTANAARVVVRSALDTTIGEVGIQQAAWFERLALIGADGLLGRPLPLKTLAVAAYREFKDIAPGMEDALVQAALMGSPLPESLLTALVIRCRLDTDSRVTYPRAALLKYILTQSLPLEEAHLMTQEVTGDKPAAYHCGRLFAELEDIQKQAIQGINAGISDKFFGAASTAPASVFGQLLGGARDHLGKLRRSREGAYHGAEKRLEEIMSEIKDFPMTLSLRDQALFSLGYYHHRAAKRKDIADRTAAKQQSNTITLDTDSLTSEGATE